MPAARGRNRADLGAAPASRHCGAGSPTVERVPLLWSGFPNSPHPGKGDCRLSDRGHKARRRPLLDRPRPRETAALGHRPEAALELLHEAFELADAPAKVLFSSRCWPSRQRGWTSGPMGIWRSYNPPYTQSEVALGPPNRCLPR
jgi:hypothetical protein